MQEFSSVTASSYDADALAPLLSEKSADGWDVISIVSAGTNIVAYLSREKTADTATGDGFDNAGAVGTIDEGSDSAFVPLAVEEAAAADVAIEDEPVAEEPAVEPVDEPAGWGTEPEAVETQPEPVVTPAAEEPSGRPDGCRRIGGPCRLVRRPVRPLRTALLGWQRLDRARLARRPAVHRSAGRLTRS